MDKNHQEDKKFLKEQLEWCNKQDRILEEINLKLLEMRKIAEYAYENELASIEIDELNNQLNELKCEVDFLNKQRSVAH